MAQLFVWECRKSGDRYSNKNKSRQDIIESNVKWQQFDLFFHQIAIEDSLSAGNSLKPLKKVVNIAWKRKQSKSPLKNIIIGTNI